MNYLGDFAEDSTVRIALTTNNGDGAAVAPSSAFEAADFVIYKNGSATQKATTNGITCTSPFDSVVGLHILEIDTSNDTGDGGFWTTAADYWVVAIPDETIDSQIVVQVVATFSIENRIRVKSTDAVTVGALNPSVIDGNSFADDAIAAKAIASNAITSSKIAANAIGASQLASDAVTEIQSGLATSSALTTVEGKVDTLLSRITSTLFSGITYLSRWLGAIAGKTADTTTRAEINATTAGAGYNETTDSQEAIRDRGDAAWTSGEGGGSVNVAPLQATAPNRVAGTEIVTYINDTSAIGPIAIADADGDAVNLSSYTLKVCIEKISDGTILANITPSVSGTGSNQITFTPTSDCVSTTKPAAWSLRSTSNGEVLGYGPFTVESAARLS